MVQAPAGSGKTTLLVARFLALLKRVKHPEACLAITFTRKAAQEMRERVLQALLDSKIPLAAEILKQPDRLKILTIDAWCADLAARLPIVTSFGAKPKISDDSAKLYKKAIDLLLENLETSNALILILEHLGNNLNLLEELLLSLLPKREQWLSYIYGIKNKDSGYLGQLIDSALSQLESEYLLELQAFWPELENLEAAKNLADLILTQAGDLRKRKPKNFEDQDWEDLINNEALVDSEGLKLLHRMRSFPENSAIKNTKKDILTYKDTELMRAIAEILPLSVGYLGLVFREKSEIDFQEVLIRAIDALGQEENPSDLALILDYQLEHILVDEFQDTSILQWKLLEQLTGSWQKGDSKTLFLVGDPMQSIYRFRQADVGIFLKIKEYGIENIPIQFLRLTSNFRSQALLVDHLNQLFSRIFPKAINLSLGAVPFSNSKSAVPLSEHAIFKCHAYENQDYSAESLKAIQLIQALRQKRPEAKIAILARNRNHLKQVLQDLKQADIPYQGLELSHLLDNKGVQEAWLWLRALSNPVDQLAWMSVLRGPLMGIALPDLTRLTEIAQESSLGIIIEKLEFFNLNLSQDALLRLQFLSKILKKYKPQFFDQKIRSWFPKIWKAVGGLEWLAYTHSEAPYAEFLNLLESETNFDTWHELEEKLATLYWNHVSHDENPVQIMTIHKAKGLEFDEVILLGLGRTLVQDQTPLFLWSERWWQNQPYLLFSTLKKEGEEPSALFNFMWQEQKLAQYYEELRLLYVATTRAKQGLYLLGKVQFFEKYDLKHELINSHAKSENSHGYEQRYLLRLPDPYYTQYLNNQPNLAEHCLEKTEEDLNRAKNWEEYCF